jgi:hypothetical protein
MVCAKEEVPTSRAANRDFTISSDVGTSPNSIKENPLALAIPKVRDVHSANNKTPG